MIKLSKDMNSTACSDFELRKKNKSLIYDTDHIETYFKLFVWFVRVVLGIKDNENRMQ